MNHLLISSVYQLQLDVSVIRRIQYVIESKEFNELFEKATNKQEILYYIANHNYDALKEWIDYQKVTDLDTCTVKQLRLMAKDLKIQDYNYMPKDILIERIKNERPNHQRSFGTTHHDDISFTSCGGG